MFDAASWAAIFRNLPTFMKGLGVTVEMAAAGLVIALALGVVLGLFASGENRILRGVARVYVEFFQNTPLMLQALFLFYAITYSHVASISPVLCGMIALGIYHGAYIAEVIRAGIASIPKGQSEAAYAQGFGYVRTMQLVVLPQTVKIILPPMVNQVVALIKNTSCMLLAGGALDLISLTNAFAVGESTARYARTAYCFSAILFFAICFPLSTLASRWEARIKSRDTAVLPQTARKKGDANV